MLQLPLVGRDAELQLLQDRLQAATESSGGLVLVSGEAGVGKTTLVSRFLSLAKVAHAIGRCPGLGETPPFGPWLEALAAWGEQGPLATGDGTARSRAFLLSEWLGRMGPRIILLEDMHWSDSASRELLVHLTPLLNRSATLLIATYRADELQREHPLWSLLPELRRLGAVQVSLERLDYAGVLKLTEASLPGVLLDREALSRHLHQRTGGHPLFVCEMLAVAARNSGLQPDSPLPETVLQAIDIKLHRLSEAAFNALLPASVIGERFSYRLLAEVVDLSEEELAEALEEAAALRLIHPAGADLFRFDHALVREALQARILAPRRRRWHLRIAEALLGDLNPAPEAVGLHLHLAGDQRAAPWLKQAGDKALRLGAHVEARQLYEQTLQWLQAADSLRAEVLLRIGHTRHFQRALEGQAYWEDVLPVAEAAGDLPVAAWMRHFRALEMRRGGDPDFLAAMAASQTEQQSLLGDERFRALERDLYGSNCGYPSMAGERAVTLAMTGHYDEALALVSDLRAAEPAGVHAAALSYAELYVAIGEGDFRAIDQAYVKVQDERLRLRQYTEVAAMQFNRFFTWLIYRTAEPAELEQMAQEVERAHTEALERSGLGVMRGGGGFSPMGVYQFLRGDWQGARRNLLEYFRQAPHDQRHQRRWFAVRLAMEQLDLTEARSLLAGMHPHSPAETPGPYFNQVVTHALWADYYLASGDLTEARYWLEAADTWTERAGLKLYRPLVYFAWTRFHLFHGDAAAAKASLEPGLQLMERLTQTLYAPEGYRLAALVAAAAGESGAVRPWLDRSLSVAERAMLPYEAALTQLLFGTLLPQEPSSRALVAAARDQFEALRAQRSLQRAEAVLAALPRRRPSRESGDSILSDREEEVALLVAAGLTDREVGARLFISHRTVDRHLRNIFIKLGVSTRSALAAHVARMGWMDN